MWYVIMELKITPSGQTIVKPTALGPVANTDTKLLIYGLFQKGRVLAQEAGAPIAEPVPRRLVSVNLENASRIRAFGSVRIFGHDAIVKPTALGPVANTDTLSC